MTVGRKKGRGAPSWDKGAPLLAMSVLVVLGRNAEGKKRKAKGWQKGKKRAWSGGEGQHALR